MTDRVNFLHVALEKDIRTDDIKPLITAIKQLRGVLKVEKNISDPCSWVIEQRVRQELGEKLISVIYPNPSN